MLKKVISNSKRGFTVIEVLVVVVIIVVLISIIVMAGSSARAAARDNQRITDIRLIQIKLESYRDQNGAYPSKLDQLGLSQMPLDPSSKQVYSYAGLAFLEGETCMTYHLGATLETNAGALAQKANQNLGTNLIPPYYLCANDSVTSLDDFDATADPLIYDVVSPATFQLPAQN